MRHLLVVCGIALLSFAGCGGDDDEPPPCEQGCKKLDRCGLCVVVEGDTCLTVSECIQGCVDEQAQDEARCVVNVSGCNETALEACING